MNHALFDDIRGLPHTFPGLQAVPIPIVYLMGCRGFDQFCCTLRGLIEPNEFCVFCERELVRQQRVPVTRNEYWRLYSNPFKHRNTKAMWLIVPVRHILRPSELTPDEAVELPIVFERLESLGAKSGGVMWRFGDPRQHTGTIEHMHINVSEQNPGTEYRPPFAKKMWEHEEDYRRLVGFCNELRRRGYDWLFSSNGIESTQPKAA